MRYLYTASLAALLAGSILAPAGAQPATGMTHRGSAATQAGREVHNEGGRTPMNHMQHAGMPMHNLAMMAQHPKGTVAFYRAELAITAAQEPQWAAFAAVLGDAVVAMHAAAMRMGAPPAPATAPDRMDATVATLTGALGTAKALADTGKALYAVLTAEQRVLADGFWAQQMPAPMP